MKKRFSLTKKIISVLLCVALLLSYLPLSAFAADVEDNPYFDRVVDANTMNNWTKYFDLDNLDTTNAGGIWTDKSVFTDASVFGGKVPMINNKENFLTALSALAANKEVVGYSTIPTDTVLVLDLSGSMDNSNSEQALVNATNDAIKELFAVNKNNRVGVVLYSASGTTGSSTYGQSVTRILPIDRYTTGADDVYLNLSNNTVSVDRDVKGTNASANLDKAKAFGGGTYIQAGLWEAMKMFTEMDTAIGDNNWQAGDNRMPILVLMSDGAASTGTSFYDDVENSSYLSWQRDNRGNWIQVNVSGSNVGNGNESGLLPGNAFLTQLTASYVMNRVENHYQKINPDVRGLFYTLGFNISGNSVATSVMNPDASNLTDDLWSAYNTLTSGNLSVSVKNTNGNTSDVAISKNSYANSKSYVDEYFSASNNGLADAFDSIVEEIILQSRYYPTHLEGGNPDFSGYIEFEDKIGDYMEVKQIAGILLGETFFDGHMMASKLSTSATGGLGTPEAPTELGNEFIWSIQSRLGINNVADARALVGNAWRAGQLYFDSATGEYSNYIGWYAKADGSYAGFWDEKSTSAAPSNAVYKIKSYGFLGETTGSIKNSDMMYMTVQVRTDIATGSQSVIWKIPAALVPVITYEVSLEGANVNEAKNVQLTVKNAESVSPIRLIFESGLRSDLNELNITRITDERHIASDGVTRRFWTNFFDISAAEHDDHITALSEFTPSKENERFYYTFDSAVFKLQNGNYVLLNENDGTNGVLDPNGEYYHRRYVFNNKSTTPVFIYEKMSSESIGAAKWDAGFVTMTNEVGAYVVPSGTPARELKMYDEQKIQNSTDSARMVFHPYLTEENNVFYVDMNLGNNGLLNVTPAQGIKLSKTVDIIETGTSTDFRFLITVRNANGSPYNGSADSWLTALDVVPLGASSKINFAADGTYEVGLSADQTFWITGLPAGANYTVEEISDNADYKIKSVHVNGHSTGTVASGTVAAHYIDDVSFVNTAIGEGDLVITKRVVDKDGNVIDVNDNVLFTAEVTLTDSKGKAVSGTFDASNASGEITVPSSGKFTVTLHDGESFVLRNIPEETNYTVTEINVPAGFVFNQQLSNLEGVIDATANDQALIVNNYEPISTNGQNVNITISKTISGNRNTWINGESYSFEVRALNVTRANTTIATFDITSADVDKKHSINLSAENYTEAGTYYYAIVEKDGSNGGITYDLEERRFSITVDDTDLDGDLEIVSVDNNANTVVTKSGSNYNVAADFNNVYYPVGSATVNINISKKMNGNYRLSGFQFALYDNADIHNANEIMRSTVTDAEGNAHFTLNYAPNRATIEGSKYTYYIAEINTGNPNITYDTNVYTVIVTVKDNGDGTISATSAVSGLPTGVSVPTFTNTFTPSASAYVTLVANKTILGDRILNANEFDFVIESLTNGAPMPENDIAHNAANGAVVFDTIKFDTVGTYKYKIYESTANKIGGFDYDSRFYEVTVTVVDNGDATLSASVSRVVKESENESGRTLGDDELITFENKYDAKDVIVTLSGDKLLTGKTLQNNEFTFVLTPDKAGYPMPSSNTATNDLSGKFTFGKITYSKAGVYTYTITERTTNDQRYDFDTSVYKITVTVTDNSIGALHYNVAISKNGLDSNAIVFRNGFVPTPITFDINATFGGSKVLDGRPLYEGEFEFALINAIDGKRVGDTVKNDASGNFKFPVVSLPEAGVYHYKIVELVGDEKNVSYDTSSYHIRLQVAQNDDGTLYFIDDTNTAVYDGKLLYKGVVTKENVNGVLTEVTKYENITANGSIVFNNSYSADPVHVNLGATKKLDGRDLIDCEFKFDLHKTAADFVYNNDTVIGDDIVLSLNDDGTGSVAFMPLTFDSEGKYYYVIVEDEVDEKGITVDKTVYKVTITVSDDHKGNYVASININDIDLTADKKVSDIVIFNNKYSIDASEIIISGTKTFKGKDLAGDDFEFALYDSDGKLIETVKNNAKGSFVFSPLPLTEAGEYNYTVKEVVDNVENVEYDDSVYTVTVKATDNLDGTFKVEYFYKNGNENTDAIVFNNVYVEPIPEPEAKPETDPDSDSPKTGDSSAIWLWFAAMFVSGGVLFGTVVTSKKIKRDEK